MKYTIAISALAGLVFAACATEPATATSSTTSPLTTSDTDVAPECVGILGYVNWAGGDELSAYLPAGVANALIARRAVQPFASIADISSISGIAQARLAQITQRALVLDFIDQECAGVYEELAVSHDDRAAILAYVNTVSQDALVPVLRSEAEATAAALIAARPFTTLQQLVDIDGIGISSFRSIRDAAIDGPFDLLVDRVNAAASGATISTAFSWFGLVFEEPGRPRSITCFGISPDIVNQVFGTIRPTLADGAEVLAQVTSAVSTADRFHAVGDATAGLSDLSAQVTGQTFFGCYLRYAPDPWSGIDRAFFVNTATGYRVFTEIRWSE